MIDFNDIVALRESIIRLRGISANKKSVFWDNELAIFDDVQRLDMPLEARKVNITIFGLCLEGRCSFSIDTRQMEFEKGSFVVVFPGQTLQIHEMSHDIKGLFICVGMERTQEMMNRLQDVVPLFMYIRQHPCAMLDDATMKWMQTYHHMLFEELHTNDNIFSHQTAHGLLTALYYKTCNIFGRQLASTPLRNSRQEDIFVQFVHCLEANFRKRREVSFYAQELCVTPKYLSTVVKAVSGRSAGACIDSYVIEEAKVLMRTTRKSVQEVSDMLNFPNQSFFGKYFKRLTGYSPHQYRKAARII